MANEAASRETDIAAKQDALVALLRDLGRDGLLLLDPANFSWFTAGASARGVSDPAEHPAAYLQNSYRWVICSNVDTQRLFDEELDGLGFQVKEWPWHWGRAQLLADLCHGKRLACDLPFADCHVVGGQLQSLRRRLSPWERERLREVAKTVVHAVEATCRNLQRGESEEEIAGQLSHRLLHRGLQPIDLQVSADGRMRKYRRHGPTTAKVEQTCVVQATARRFGLHVTAARAMSFGEPDAEFRREIETACRWSAVLIAASTNGARLGDVLNHGERFMETAGFEHEWRLAPLGWVTGYAANELGLLPSDANRTLEPGWSIVWLASVGAVANADTVLLREEGPQIVTAAELWPLKRIRVAGQTIDRPDVLIREA